MKALYKTSAVFFISLLCLPLIILQTSCNKNVDKPDETNSGITDLIISDNFDWSTSDEVNFKVTVLGNTGTPLSGVKVGVFTNDPVKNGSLIVSGVTDVNGEYSLDYKVPSYYDSIFVQTDYVGVISPGMISVGNNGFNIVLGGLQQPIPFKSNLKISNTAFGYGYLGGYNTLGVPDYLEPVNDVITQDLLNDINNTLPERSPLFVSHPEYLQPEWDYNLNLIEDCDVWITFVHEGAGYKNVLGFFTYETGEAPQTPGDIDEITIIYPNVSYAGSGGGLHSGNKVFIGQFEAGTTVSFALMANGWRNGGVTNGNWIVYSTPQLNPEADPDLRQHAVLLNDNGRNLLLLGFEDIRRDRSNCDHDFNDAVFYVTANPIEAIDQSQFPNMDYTGTDTDGDGIPDNVDDYPDDSNKAFDNFFFNEGNFGTLAFEDMWPSMGDYDFNDAVIDYNFNQITNADNDVVEIKGYIKLMAHGAYFHNGFGFQLPFDKNLIESVNGDLFVDGDIVNLDSKNLETNQSLPVIIVWEDAFDVLPQSGGGIGVNTTPGIEYVTPQLLEISIELSSPVALSDAGIPPYNPFIFINEQRDLEIHLVDEVPTDLANTELFGTDADNSDPTLGRYYKTATNLPWAINIIEEFEYPVEKADITTAYLKFGEWAESNGDLFNDWWQDKSGYRNVGNIYEPDTE
jgi:LruC domain-containing protein